jgi:signal transduction histidine kinase/ligand-binding sensor domain-containing protein/DNA-binding response OmpR family regulator
MDIARGLSHNEVHCIFKDEKGFQWFGTMSGLNRYDGYRFKVFRHDPHDPASINDDCVYDILEGPGHTLWVSTRNGFTVYDPRTEKFNSDPSFFLQTIGLPASAIDDIRKDRQDNYWFLSKDSGLYYYQPAHRQAARLVHRDGDPGSLHSDHPAAFAMDTHGDLWIVHSDGLIDKMDGKNHRIVYKSEALHKTLAHPLTNYKLYIDAQDDLWAYSTKGLDGLFYLDPRTAAVRQFRNDAHQPSLNTNLVTGIVQDDKGLIWIATDHGGINLLDKRDFSIRYITNREGDEKSIGQNCIQALYKDNAGIIWIGTYKKGICYYDEHSMRFPLYRHQLSNPNSLGYDDVNRFVEDAKGNIWIGTNGGGLIYFNRSTEKFTRYTHQANDPGSLSNDVIVSMCIDHEQKLWIGTYYGGLDRFDGKRFVHYRHNESDSNSIGDDRIWEIKEDSRQRLWIGTLSAGLDLFDRQKNRFIHYRPGRENSVHASYISELMEDRKGNLWIGTDMGIDVLEKVSGRFRHYDSRTADAHGLSNNNIISIFEDSRGLVWVGTRDGLDLFDEAQGNFKTFRTADGLPDNTVLTILEDNAHALWLGTPNGLSNMIVAQGGQAGKYSFQWRNYDESDGLQGREFNENAALRTRNGELIFGGANGFNLFDPQHIQPGKHPPGLVLTDLQVFNKSMGIGEKLNGHVILPQSISELKGITLHYNENVFSIEFAALDFASHEKAKYAYMLEGFNKQWLQVNDRSRKATFTNLDPGDYTFKLRITDDMGGWRPEELSLPVKILPPFWKTPLAYTLYILLLAGILILSRRMIVQRTRMRFIIEQERKDARQLHELDMMKIKFFTNVSHEFRTPLSLILTPLDKIIRNTQHPAQKEQFHLIYRNARRLLNMVNQLLDFRKLEVQELRLNPAHADIVRFIKELSFSFADIAEKKSIGFSFESDLTTFYTSFDQDKLERIVFNLLSNAFKFTPEHGQVKVSVALRTSPDAEAPCLLQLMVRDSGIGIEKDKQERIFERFFQQEIPGSMVNQGSGIGLAITKEFVKLHNGSITVESEPGQGACFTVLLPVVSLEISGSVELPVEPPAAVPDRPAKAGGKGLAGIRKPSILLVEDNEDFRFYLKDNLKEFFTIIEASDGKEGWHKTLGAHPALVVSDISMPEMNGIDLCRKIKGDPRTAFIPVILLTALLGEEQQLEGLETGANDYMTKPFNFEILLSKIRNLLTQQETARKTWQKQVEAGPAAVNIESADEKFIRQVLALIEQNISNPEFSVEEMSRELFLSRVALYKKVLAFTGKTPVELIRSIRLKRAVQLLEKNQFTVAEIAYEVGFNDPKYFSRHFKAEFGILPSAYQRSSGIPGN